MSGKTLLYPLTAVMMLLTINSCYFPGPGGKRIQGEGPYVTKDIDIPTVRGIVIRNSADVVLSQGNRQRLSVEAQQNIIDNLKTEVSNGILYVGNRSPVWKARPVRIKLRINDLTNVRISGSGDIVSEGKFDGLNDLEVVISGSGDIKLDVEADNIDARIGGSGSITLEGDSRTVDYKINGSGSIYANELETKRAYARISGSGDIIYRGDPDVDKSISGSGNIRSR
jgi:hypothetical protein